MAKWISFFFIGALMGALSLLPACAPKTNQKECGYLQNVYGERISWKGRLPIRMKIDPSVNPELRQAVFAAADRWNIAAGKMIFEISISNEKTLPFRDGHNVIYFSPEWEGGKESEQARTSVYWVGDEMQEADIRINTQKFTFYWREAVSSSTLGQQSLARSVSLESIMVHEMGHVLGLKHRDLQGSVMETYLSARTERTEISGLDRESLSCEYM